MIVTALFTTDGKREQAGALRLLLTRIENGAGEDRVLASDVLDALDAPVLIGDVTGFVDSALHLAEFLKQDRLDALSGALRCIFERIRRGGWKTSGDVSHADAARAITGLVLRVHIAKLEGAPV